MTSPQTPRTRNNKVGPEKTDLIRNTILMSVGADVSIEVNTTGRRQGLDVWFQPWERSRGPIFQIKPSGLQGHRVTMGFGAKSGFCLKRIENRSEEQILLAGALLTSLKGESEASFPPTSHPILTTTTWGARVKGLESQHDDGSLKATTINVMVPMIAAMAELIGFEEITPEKPEVEGSVSKVLVTKRERSVRNRLLALQIHGYQCGTCRLRPLEVFGEALGGVLEVHHIEPVSELGEPRPYDPSTDLIPLCPTCHRMIHTVNPPYTPQQLKEMLEVRHA